MAETLRVTRGVHARLVIHWALECDCEKCDWREEAVVTLIRDEEEVRSLTSQNVRRLPRACPLRAWRRGARYRPGRSHARI
jgi:hypothetical protein